MDIASFFAPKAAKPPVQQPANNGGTGNVNDGGQSNNQNNNGNNGNANQNNGNPQPADPFAKFSKMWDTPSTEGEVAPAFKLDSKTLSEVADAQDFMQGIDPELMQKATSGDVQSLMAIIKKTTQNAYAKSLEHSSTLTDKFVGAREAHSSKSLGNKVRGEMTTSALAAVPNYKNPVVQKQLKQTAEQFARQHPDATPAEIVQMSIEYFQTLSAAINPDGQSGKTGDGKTPANKEVDWEKYFNQADQEQEDS